MFRVNNKDTRMTLFWGLCFLGIDFAHWFGISVVDYDVNIPAGMFTPEKKFCLKTQQKASKMKIRLNICICTEALYGMEVSPR